MALQGTFKADFTELQKAADDSTKALQGTQSAAAATTDQINRLVDQGAAKLTALGQTAAPAQIQAIADAADRAGGSFADWTNKFNLKTAIEDPIGTAKDSVLGFADALGPTGVKLLGAAAAAGAFGAELIKIGNEAEAVGADIGRFGLVFNVPVEAVSNLRFAVKAAGGDFESFGNSMFTFQKRIEDNGEAVEKGLKKIGLSIGEIKQLRPDEQFLAISDALRSTGAETNKSAVAFEIFGRQGKDILPLLIKPLSDLADESAKLGDTWSTTDVSAARSFRAEVTKLATESEEAWDTLGRTVAPVTNELVIGWDRMKLAIANVALTAAELVTLKPVAGWLGEDALAAETAAAKLDVINHAIAAGAPETIKYGQAVAYLNDQFGVTTPLSDQLSHKLQELKDQALIPLTDAQKDYISEAHKLDESAKQIATDLGVTENTVKLYLKAQQDATIASKHWQEAMDELNSAGEGWKGTLDTIDGAVAESVKYYLQAGVSQKALAEIYGVTAVQVRAVASELQNETEATKKATKAADDWAKTLADIKNAGNSVGDAFNSIDGTIVDWAKHLLASGVTAKEVADYYGLTEVQVKALDDANKKDAEALRDHDRAAQAAARSVKSFGEEAARAASLAVANFDEMNSKVMGIDTTFKGWNDTIMKTETHLKNLDLGGSFDVTSQNFEQAFKNIATVGGNLPQGLAGFNQAQAYDLARGGYSFQEIIAIMQNQRNGANGPLPPPHGPRIPGFAEGVSDFMGGLAMVGERGPELVNLPPKSDVIPFGQGGGGTILNVSVHVGTMNGTNVYDLADQVGRVVMRNLLSSRQFGAA